jgi:hypothetical protein
MATFYTNARIHQIINILQGQKQNRKKKFEFCLQRDKSVSFVRIACKIERRLLHQLTI